MLHDLLETESYITDDTITAPELRIGDVMFCMLPTDIKDRPRSLCPRRVLVLGLECQPGTDIVRGLHVVRFSGHTQKFNPDHEMSLTAAQLAALGVPGLVRNQVIRTNRIDLVPLTRRTFPQGVNTLGTITDPEFFANLAAHLQTGLNGPHAEQSRVVKQGFYKTELRQGSTAGQAPFMPHFNLQNFIARADVPLTRSDDYAKAEEAVRSIPREVAAAINATPPAPHVPDFSDYITPRRVRVKASGRRGRIERDRMVSAHNTKIRMALEQAGIVAAFAPTPAPVLELEARRPRQQTPVQTAPAMAAKKSKPALKTIYQDEATYTPILPQNLKRGDVVLVQVLDLLDENSKGTNHVVRRPAIVWDVFDDATGNITGLECLPCTREMASAFTHKLEVHAFSNPVNWDGSHVIAERLLRLPATPQYFPPENIHNRHYNPAIIAKVAALRAHVLAIGADRPAYGLKERPQHWHMRDIETRPETPESRAKYNKMLALAERDAPVWQTDSLSVGDVISRWVTYENQHYKMPAIVWGMWTHRETGSLAALDLMHIGAPDNKNSRWAVELEKLEILSALKASAPLAAHTHNVGLCANTRFFFDADDKTVITRLDEGTMNRLSYYRKESLLKCFARQAKRPVLLPYTWQRNAGVQFDLNPASMRSQFFAPDVPQLRLPGTLKRPKPRP